MSYFVRPSSSTSPGGRDGSFEVLSSPFGDSHERWSMDTTMLALCLNENVANHIASLLNRHPYNSSVPHIKT